MRKVENAVILTPDEYTALKKQKERRKSDLILLILALFLLAFIVTMIVLFCVFEAVPDTLIQYVLGAGGVEAVVLAGIKISKVFKGK